VTGRPIAAGPFYAKFKPNPPLTIRNIELVRREPVIQSRIAWRPVASPASVAFNQALQLQDGGNVRRRDSALPAGDHALVFTQASNVLKRASARRRCASVVKPIC
jgi:hypothetical protein